MVHPLDRLGADAERSKVPSTRLQREQRIAVGIGHEGQPAAVLHDVGVEGVGVGTIIGRHVGPSPGPIAGRGCCPVFSFKGYRKQSTRGSGPRRNPVDCSRSSDRRAGGMVLKWSHPSRRGVEQFSQSRDDLPGDLDRHEMPARDEMGLTARQTPRHLIQYMAGGYEIVAKTVPETHAPVFPAASPGANREIAGTPESPGKKTLGPDSRRETPGASPGGIALEVGRRETTSGRLVPAWR